jgi:hypothetical protein
MAGSDIYGRSGLAASAVARRKLSAGSIAAPALGPKQPLDGDGPAPVNAAVPKSGQLWDAAFLERSALLGDLPPSTRSRSQPIDIRQLYDGRIALHGEVPCLGTSYHDLLNVLVWGAFPRAKRALHARQYRALEAWLPAHAERLPNRRTREQDALALFDEGGSLLVVPPALAAALRAALASDRAANETLALDSAARIVLFGHAVMEHVCFESAALSSAALIVCLDPPLPEGRALFDRVDRALAARLSDPRELTSPAFDAVLTIEPPDQTRLRAEIPTR